MACEMSDIKKLHYEICKYSSYSTSYLPENIREDCPSNQTSRWSSNTNSPPQFLTLKLQRPAIVRKIKFGKYEKTHVCNLKKFKVFGGLEQEHMVLLFEGGLINDSTPESFNLRHTTDSGELLPVMYIQIMPLLSWGPSFNFSIWYVELHGQDDPIFVRTSLRNYNLLREVEIVKLCLKHFRQQGYDTAFTALQEQTNIRLEHPIMSDLHHSLVIEGDFNKTEEFITNCVHEGLMDQYLRKQDYKATWNLHESSSSDVRPGTRGGHQLIIDTKHSLMYLYGGWDGFEDLSDLWIFDMKSKLWTLIHERSEMFDGPTPRSCHKMVYDPTSEQIFMLGRYLDNTVRTKEYIKSDFYLYDTATKTWLQICDDTSQVGGPQLVYDHQMCIDVDKRTIYVFGGKILTPRNISSVSNESQYSGLFSYHIATNTWTQILVDCGHPTASSPEVQSIKARVMHCMVFHNKKRKLYIFGGHRGKDDICEFMSFDVNNHRIAVLNSDDSNCDNKNEPLPGCTQRATIDCDQDEIYVFSSLNKLKDRRDSRQTNTSNSFWMYSLKSNTWSCIYKSDHSSDHCYSKSQNSISEPCPRYAHQLVYDHVHKAHYLFGGNPGKSATPQLRLDDFWTLLLEKPTRQQILLHCKYLIRRLKYEEIAKEDPLKALDYLQNELSSVIDHSDSVQLKNFHKLAYLLFKCDDNQTEQSTLMTVPLGQQAQSLEVASSKPLGESSMCTDQSVHDDANLSSCSSSSTSSTNFQFYNMLQLGIKKNLDDHLFEMKNQRCLLYNRLVELMPEHMVQPKGNLSDFVLI